MAPVVACSVPTNELPRAGTCQPFQLTDVVPAAGTTSVEPTITPTLTFSDYPDPDSIGLSTLQLFTGPFYHTGRYGVELVDRRAVFRPSGRLTPGLGYTVAIRAGIRSLRGCDLEPSAESPGSNSQLLATYRFQVAAPGTPPAPRPVEMPTATFQEVVAIFGGHCAGSSCHLKSTGGSDAQSTDPGSTCLTDEVGGGLSLCSRDARAALTGVPSRQVNRLVLVAPGDAARSYLLRKIIGAPPVVGHIGVPDDDLSRDEQRAIQDWIDHGALPAAGAVDAAAGSPTQSADGGI